PPDVQHGTQVLFFHLGENESMQALKLMQQLRAKGISCELYHEQAKFDKQFKYAERKNIGHVVMIGSEELAKGMCTLKNLSTGKQEQILQSELLNRTF
ncbi:MAG: His/Gly/Thr/Pro-type tRNA ligase C-terminal domain-containing protein, partial [Chitinophagaceae bacterium]